MDGVIWMRATSVRLEEALPPAPLPVGGPASESTSPGAQVGQLQTPVLRYPFGQNRLGHGMGGQTAAPPVPPPLPIELLATAPPEPTAAPTFPPPAALPACSCSTALLHAAAITLTTKRAVHSTESPSMEFTVPTVDESPLGASRRKENPLPESARGAAIR